MINTTGAYALRVVVFLASSPGQLHSSATIAAATGVPTSYLSRVMLSLVRHGLVASQRGLHGGYQLQVDAREISALDVVEAASPKPRRAGSKGAEKAPRGTAHDAVGALLDRIRSDCESTLRGLSVAELSQQS